MNKKSNKLKSAKLWISLWAMGIITYIVISGKSEFLQLAVLLSTIPLAFIPANVWQKKILSDLDKNDV